MKKAPYIQDADVVTPVIGRFLRLYLGFLNYKGCIPKDIRGWIRTNRINKYMEIL